MIRFVVIRSLGRLMYLISRSKSPVPRLTSLFTCTVFQGTSVLSPATPLLCVIIPAWVIAYKSDQVHTMRMIMQNE